MVADVFYMRRAIKLALKADGKTSPNPIVGAVIVKNGRIVGEGYHKKAGNPHAEIEALNNAGKKAKGAVLYVTLEPCDHYGRTPPCTLAIINSGIRKVIIAAKDPNPITNGKGIKRLKASGIIVKTGVLAEESERMNASFEKFIKTGTPYVTLKMGESLDGKITSSTGESKWITCQESRDMVQRLRLKSDAILVGINTVMSDDPLLLPRIKSDKKPVRVIIDPHLRIPIMAQVLKTAKDGKVILAAAKCAPAKKIKILNNMRNVEVLISGGKDGRVDLPGLLKKLAKKNIMNLLVEGGKTVAGKILDERLVDKVYFFIAPIILGGDKALSTIGGIGVKRLADAPVLKQVSVERIGQDILVTGIL